jgi:hypothetical protein
MNKLNVVPIQELKTIGFTADHVDLHDQNFNKDSYPILGMSFDHVKLSKDSPDLINISFIGTDYGDNDFNQLARAGGAVTPKEYKDLQKDISNGWKLLEPLIVLFKVGKNKYLCITGHTRLRVCEEFGITNVMAYIYERTTEDDQGLKGELSEMGILAQDLKSSYARVKKEDIIIECLRAIENGYISLKGLNTQLEAADVVLGRITRMCERASFSKKVVTEMAHTVVHRAPSFEGSKVVPYTNKEAIKWMKEREYPVYEKYMDKKVLEGLNMIYWPTTYTLAEDHLAACAKLAADHDIEVRMVFHTETLTSDPIQQYKDRSFIAHSAIKTTLLNMQSVFFDSIKKVGNRVPINRNKVKLYAMFPAIESEHNLDKLRLFDRVAYDGSFKPLTNQQMLV